jgi:hypothetical protein
MDEELLRLQQELEEVQLEDTQQRLSERNVVQLILKLIDSKKLDVSKMSMKVVKGLTYMKLVYTLSGKEYLTLSQLEREINEEIRHAKGRIR